MEVPENEPDTSGHRVRKIRKVYGIQEVGDSIPPSSTSLFLMQNPFLRPAPLAGACGGIGERGPGA